MPKYRVTVPAYTRVEGKCLCQAWTGDPPTPEGS